MAIRLAVVKHHYRDPWEWDDALMPEAAARLDAWRRTSEPAVTDGDPQVGEALDAVRERLDDDLDSPGAVAAIDAAAAAGEDVSAAALLLGVDLRRAD